MKNLYTDYADLTELYGFFFFKKSVREAVRVIREIRVPKELNL